MTTGRVLVHVDTAPEISEDGFLNTANPPARGHRYYAMLNPRVLIITYRFPLERVRVGDRYDAQVGWSPGTMWAVRPGNAACQHRRIALSGLATPSTPKLETVRLSALIAEAPLTASASLDPARLTSELGSHANAIAADVSHWLAVDSGTNIGATLDQISEAALGKLKREPAVVAAVSDSVDRLIRFLIRAVWHAPDHPVDPGFWKSDIGDLCARARAWSQNDVWLTGTEAAMLRYGRSGRGAVERLEREAAARIRVVRRDHDEQNDSRAARYLRSQVTP